MDSRFRLDYRPGEGVRCNLMLWVLAEIGFLPGPLGHPVKCRSLPRSGTPREWGSVWNAPFCAQKHLSLGFCGSLGCWTTDRSHFFRMFCFVRIFPPRQLFSYQLTILKPQGERGLFTHQKGDGRLPDQKWLRFSCKVSMAITGGFLPKIHWRASAADNTLFKSNQLILG